MTAMSASRSKPPGSSVTIRDVASAAGVHVSTVSRALDPRKRQLISSEVLQQVEGAARRLGYRPNGTASALRTGRSRTIGVLLPDISNAVFPPILQGIEAAAAANGYFVMVANVAEPKLAQVIVERMLAQRVDGLVLATATRADPLIDFLAAAKVPAVLVNRADETGRLTAIVTDDRVAMHLIVHHLADRGHHRIAHLAGPGHLPTGAGRRAGFEMAMRERGLTPVAIVECTGYNRDAGRQAMGELLQAHAELDAVVCCNDLVALGAYDAIREAGLNIPADISVTGHNDMPLVDMVSPPLTTIRLPHKELGLRAAEMLFSELNGSPYSASTVVLRPELIVRASTK